MSGPAGLVSLSVHLSAQLQPLAEAVHARLEPFVLPPPGPRGPLLLGRPILARPCGVSVAVVELFAGLRPARLAHGVFLVRPFFPVLAGGALAVLRASDSHLEAFAVFFLAVALLAVAAFVVQLRSGVENRRERERVSGFDRVYDPVSFGRVLRLVMADLTQTLNCAVLPESEALTVELQTFGIFTGAVESFVWGLRTFEPVLPRAFRGGLLKQASLFVAQVLAKQLLGKEPF